MAPLCASRALRYLRSVALGAIGIRVRSRDAAIRTVHLELDDTGLVAGWHPFPNVTRIVRALREHP